MSIALRLVLKILAALSRRVRSEQPATRRLALRQAPVDREIVLGHASGGEALLEPLAYLFGRQSRQAVDRAECRLLVLDDKSCHSLIDHVGHGATIEGNDRRTAGHRLDHHETEWLGPVDRHEQSQGAAEKNSLFLIVDFADVLDARRIEKRANGLLEVGAIYIIDFGCDFNLHAAPSGNAYRAVDALLRGDATEKGKITRRHRLGDQQVRRQPMRNRPYPVPARNRTPLSIGD